VGSPLVSCVVAVFNGEPYLDAALRSILDQTHRPLEVVVVDDGSTDRTAAVVAGFGHQVRALRQPNGGPASARNRGLAEAWGDLVAFLDADDLWHPEKLARQVARFRERPDLDASLTLVQNFWVPELRHEEERCRRHRIAQPAPGYLTGALLARRTVFERVGRFDETWRHVHDTEWFARARDAGVVFEELPEVLMFRRLHLNNRSRRLADASRDEYLRLMKARVGRRGGPAMGVALPPPG
jgi:glycosyltransferase involved in cell wall biosynthesis